MDATGLLNAIGKGDDLALRELFEHHAPWLAPRLRRSMPPDGVEDVLQETFIAVWRGAGTYRGDGAANAWLWSIARRQAALWLRKRGRPDAELGLDVRAPEDPAAEAVDKVDLQRALTTLGSAGTAQRELVRLALEEGRPMAEVAAELGISEGTVKSRLHRVRLLLRRALR